jgi:hypothetical protein
VLFTNPSVVVMAATSAAAMAAAPATVRASSAALSTVARAARVIAFGVYELAENARQLGAVDVGKVRDCHALE